jgi:hypothetical protein
LDGLAELQVRWPNVPIVFCENRSLAEEWTYRFLAAAQVWAQTESLAVERIEDVMRVAPTVEEPADPPRLPPGDDLPVSVAEVRAWAMSEGMPVADRGRLRPEIWAAWRRAQAFPRLTPSPREPARCERASSVARVCPRRDAEVGLEAVTAKDPLLSVAHRNTFRPIGVRTEIS